MVNLWEYFIEIKNQQIEFNRKHLLMSIFLNKVMYPDPTTENLLKNQLSKIQTEIAHATILSGKKKKNKQNIWLQV